MLTPQNSPHSMNYVKSSSETVLEDDLLGIYQQLQDIAESVMLPSDETKFSQSMEDGNFNEIEGFYKEIDHKERQIRILVEISSSLLTKTKEKIICKEQEIHFIEENVLGFEGEIQQGRERMAESNEIISSLNSQKEQLESYLSDLEIGYERTQDNLFRSQEEFISLGEYKRKFHELNDLLDQNNDLLSFYKQTNEDLRREHKSAKVNLSNSKFEVEGMRKKLTVLLETYEKSISKQTNLNKQKISLQEQISKIKDDIKSIQQLNSGLIKDIERDQMKRVRGVTKISSVGFLQGFTREEMESKKPSCLKNRSKIELYDDKTSIDMLIENEEKEKTHENLRTPQLLEKCGKIEEKDQKLTENAKKEAKPPESTYENFSSFKNALEINVVSQKSEEFGEADRPKFFNAKEMEKVKPGQLKNNRNNVDFWGGLVNFWMIGGLTVLFSIIVIAKAQSK